MIRQTLPYRLPAPRLRGAIVVALAAAVALSLLYTPAVYQRLGSHAVLWIYNLTVCLIAWVGVGLSFRLWRSFEPGEVLRTIWASLTLGLLLWTLGEGIWSVDQLIFGEQLPYPSAADGVWLAGYIPMCIGLYLRNRSLQIMPALKWRLALFGMFLALTTLAVALVIQPIVASGGGGVQHLVNLLYPIGDLVIAFGSLLIMLALVGGALSEAWGLVAAGYFLASVSDLLFAFADWRGIYQVGIDTGVNFISYLVDLLYAMSYIVVTLGLYLLARLQKAI